MIILQSTRKREAERKLLERVKRTLKIEQRREKEPDKIQKSFTSTRIERDTKRSNNELVFIKSRKFLKRLERLLRQPI